MMSRRVRSNPLSVTEMTKLDNTYVVMWYNSTQSYSEVFKLRNSIFAKYPVQTRLQWSAGSSLFIEEDNQKHLATVLVTGELLRVAQFASELEKNMHSDYDTEAALQFAENFEKEDDSDNSDDQDENYSPPPDCPLPVTLQMPRAIETNREDPEVARNQKRAKLMADEANKVKALRGNHFQSGLPSSPSASSQADSASRIFASSPASGRLGASSSMSATLRDNEAELPEDVPNEEARSLVHGEEVLKKLDSLIKVSKESKRILEDIRNNTNPVMQIETDMSLPTASGGLFRIDEIPADVPTKFAIQCVDRLMGSEYLLQHRFEQDGNLPSQTAPAQPVVIDQLKAALRARFGQSHWRAVRLSLNQASRDRFKKQAKERARRSGQRDDS